MVMASVGAFFPLVCFTPDIFFKFSSFLPGGFSSFLPLCRPQPTAGGWRNGGWVPGEPSPPPAWEGGSGRMGIGIPPEAGFSSSGSWKKPLFHTRQSSRKRGNPPPSSVVHRRTGGRPTTSSSARRQAARPLSPLRSPVEPSPGFAANRLPRGLWLGGISVGLFPAVVFYQRFGHGWGL